VILSKIIAALGTGIAQGAMVALVALGYTMVFGVLKMINFAHSEVFMMAAYVGLFVIAAVVGQGNPIVAAVVGTLVAMMAAAALGVLVERVAYRPLRKRAGSSKLARVTPLVTALGVSVLLQNLAQLLQSTRPIIIVVAVIVMAGLEAIIKLTWFGKAMRALSANEEAARLMGVRTSRVIMMTFALGSALAAIGAVLYCLDQSQTYPTMGFKIGTLAFVAAVLGGIGSIPGAMLGGLLIGILGEMVKLTDYSGGVDVLVFVVLIAVLLVRPAGLLGSVRVEKV
jgi:branched-chain amino acid transport system permease protein